MVNDDPHQLIGTEKFDLLCMLCRKHINHFVRIGGYIKIRHWLELGIQRLHAGQTIHTKMGNSLMLMRVTNQIIMVVLPLQSIGVQNIEISIVFQDFLFLWRVLIVLETDLVLIQDSSLNAINDVIDLFVMRLHTAGEAGQPLELFRLLDAGQLSQLLN